MVFPFSTVSQPSVFTFMPTHSHVLFCVRSSELIWRDLTVTGRKGGLGTRLKLERMLAVDTDQWLSYT